MTATNGTLALDVRGVSKSFGTFRALSDVSFQVPTGSTFGLLGPNGAGKTTLLSIIANFLRASAGSISVLGAEHRQVHELAGRMTILPQDAQFQRNVPILEQLVFFRRLAGVSARQGEQDALEALASVGLEHVAQGAAPQLSHGMYKRLGIAQALLGKPDLMILDEPTAGLDPKNRRTIRNIVRDLQGVGTVVISSHDLGEIQELCTHVAILDHGQLVTYGPVDEITRGHSSIEIGLSRDLVQSEGDGLLELPGVQGLEALGKHRYRVALETGAEQEAADADATSARIDEAVRGVLRFVLDAGITPRQVSQGTSLEDHFLQVTGPGSDD